MRVILVLIAAVYAAMVTVLAAETCSSFPSCLKPNEWGDFVAGFTAPVALLWVGVAVFLQRQELQLSRSEMLKNFEFIDVQIALLQEQNMLEKQREMKLKFEEGTNELHEYIVTNLAGVPFLRMAGADKPFDLTLDHLIDLDRRQCIIGFLDFLRNGRKDEGAWGIVSIAPEHVDKLKGALDIANHTSEQVGSFDIGIQGLWYDPMELRDVLFVRVHGLKLE